MEAAGRPDFDLRRPDRVAEEEGGLGAEGGGESGVAVAVVAVTVAEAEAELPATAEDGIVPVIVDMALSSFTTGDSGGRTAQRASINSSLREGVLKRRMKGFGVLRKMSVTFVFVAVDFSSLLSVNKGSSLFVDPAGVDILNV